MRGARFRLIGLLAHDQSSILDIFYYHLKKLGGALYLSLPPGRQLPATPLHKTNPLIAASVK